MNLPRFTSNEEGTEIYDSNGEKVNYLYIPGHVYSSKNSRVITAKKKIIPSKGVRKWRRTSKKYWVEKRKRFHNLTENMNRPLPIGFYFIRKTAHKYDWINPLQTIQDEMVRNEWIEDDDISQLLPVPVWIDDQTHEVSKEHAGVIIIPLQ